MPQVVYLTDKYDIIEVNTRCDALAYVCMASRSFDRMKNLHSNRAGLIMKGNDATINNNCHNIKNYSYKKSNGLPMAALINQHKSLDQEWPTVIL